jgi:hypothetical protein
MAAEVSPAAEGGAVRERVKAPARPQEERLGPARPVARGPLDRRHVIGGSGCGGGGEGIGVGGGAALSVRGSWRVHESVQQAPLPPIQSSLPTPSDV